MNNKFFTKNGEWVVIEGKSAICGLSRWSVDELGEITFVALPPVGNLLKAGEPALTVEAVKAATDCYAPVSGTITEVNDLLKTEPSWLNKDPEGQGWIFKAEVSELIVDDLMTEKDFQSWIQDPHE